jgi:serine/threonine protein kinase
MHHSQEESLDTPHVKGRPVPSYKFEATSGSAYERRSFVHDDDTQDPIALRDPMDIAVMVTECSSPYCSLNESIEPIGAWEHVGIDDLPDTPTRFSDGQVRSNDLMLWFHNINVAGSDEREISRFSPLSVDTLDFDVLPTNQTQWVDCCISATSLRTSCGFEVHLVLGELEEPQLQPSALASQDLALFALKFRQEQTEKSGAQKSKAPTQASDTLEPLITGTCPGEQEPLTGTPFSSEVQLQPQKAAQLFDYWLVIYETKHRDDVIDRLGACGVMCHELTVRCTVDTMIGSGSFSRVFSGQMNGKQVAIKRLGSTNKYSSVRSEVGMVLLAKGCPHFPGFLGLFHDPGTDFGTSIVLERAMGGDLYEYVSAVGNVGEAPALQILLGIIAGLLHLHTLPVPIVHRDVKVENVLLTASREPLLSDMGLAAFVTDTKEMCKRLGSPGYAAPEVLLGNMYGTQVDLFGAGVILYFIIDGRLPFAGRTIASVLRRTLRCNVDYNEKVWGSLTDGTQSLTRKLLRFDPEERIAPEPAMRMIKQIQADMTGQNVFAERRTWSAQPAMPYLRSRQHTNCLDITQLQKGAGLNDLDIAFSRTTSGSSKDPALEEHHMAKFQPSYMKSPQIASSSMSTATSQPHSEPHYENSRSSSGTTRSRMASRPDDGPRKSWAPGPSSGPQAKPAGRHRAIHRPSEGFTSFTEHQAGERETFEIGKTEGEPQKSIGRWSFRGHEFKFRRAPPTTDEPEPLLAENMPHRFLEPTQPAVQSPENRPWNNFRLQTPRRSSLG